MNDQLNSVLELLEQIESDQAVPKNVRSKVKDTMEILHQSKEIPVKINESLQKLDELSDDQNIPQYIRTQIWSIVSFLEAMSTK